MIIDSVSEPSIAIGSPEEGRLAQELIDAFPTAVEENARMVRFMALCCLRNRGYDMASARKRLGKYLEWRKETFGNLLDQTVEDNETLRSQIHSGMVYICPDRTPEGAAIMFVRMRRHDPSTYDSLATVRCWHYMVLTALMQDPGLASNGFLIVNNFEGATTANLDISVPRAISSALNKCMPIRVVSINAVNPPWILRMVIPVVKSLLSAKLAERLNVVLDHAELPGLLSIPQEILPTELDGEVDVDADDGYLHKLAALNLAV